MQPACARLSFYKIATYYYYPGWWEGGTANHFNLEKWNKLPKNCQAIFTGYDWPTRPRKLRWGRHLERFYFPSMASGVSLLSDPLWWRERAMSDQHRNTDQAFLQRQRKRLEELQRQLQRSEDTAAQELSRRADQGREARELEEDAQDLAEREIDEAVQRHDDRRLRAVKRALRKIEEGTYGLSDLSGAPIPAARLQAIPEALLTVEEEAQAEKRQR